jgi:hypothetical protein
MRTWNDDWSGGSGHGAGLQNGSREPSDDKRHEEHAATDGEPAVVESAGSAAPEDTEVERRT